MAAGNFVLDRVFIFFTIIMSFWGKKCFLRNSLFPVRSVFVINLSLFTSVVCYCQMDNEENMENARYATNDDTLL